jgi:hypothetical protein
MTNRSPSQEPKFRLLGSPSDWVGLGFLYFFSAIIATDLCAIELPTLTSLDISYPWCLHLTPLVVPGGCALLSRYVQRTQPVLGIVLPLFVCYTLVLAIPGFVAMQTKRIELNPASLGLQFGATFNFPIAFQNNEAIVAPINEERARAELARLGMLRKP